MLGLIKKICPCCYKPKLLVDFWNNNKLLRKCLNCRNIHYKSMINRKCIHGAVRGRCKICFNSIDITIKRMISNTKRTDKHYNRFNAETHINYDYLKNLIDNSTNCYYCRCNIQYVNYCDTLGTIERLSNYIGHNRIGNCVIACRKCNLTGKDRVGYISDNH